MKRVAIITLCFVIGFLVVGGIFSGVVAATSSHSESIKAETLEEVVNAWGQKNKATDRERGAIILSKKENGKKVYYVTRTYIGVKHDVVAGFIA
ncbi:MAG: hypothetical protein FWD32_01955, partial [Firmicutes bacterium]|nr:hypothetical protein [Bacillota bacterium]